MLRKKCYGWVISINHTFFLLFDCIIDSKNVKCWIGPQLHDIWLRHLICIIMHPRRGPKGRCIAPIGGCISIFYVVMITHYTIWVQLKNWMVLWRKLMWDPSARGWCELQNCYRFKSQYYWNIKKKIVKDCNLWNVTLA